MISPPSTNPAPHPRQNALDEEKRRTILALLTNGSSRRAAARHIGCNPSSITRLAARDPDFARQMAAAQQTIEVQCLHAIRTAASENRQWRAAAWLLEHKYPDDFGSRRPHTFTMGQLFDLLSDAAQQMLRTIPLKDSQSTACCLDEFIQVVWRQLNAQCHPPVQRVAHTLQELALPDTDLSDSSDDDSDDDRLT